MRINARFGDAPEKELPKEQVYDLRIRSKEVGKKEETGRITIQCWITIESDDGTEYEDILYVMVFPTDADWQEKPDTAKLMLRNNQRFLAVFGVEFGADGFDEEELDGATGRCLVKIGKDNRDQERPELSLPRIQV